MILPNGVLFRRRCVRDAHYSGRSVGALALECIALGLVSCAI